jgi:ABC-2 type transport system permease protein
MMQRLVKMEMRKLLGTRSTWGIIAAMAAVIAIAAFQTAISAEEGKALWERQGFFFATIQVQLFMLVLGAKYVTDDFRFGTIVPSLLVSPRRERYVLSKLAVALAGGLVAAAIGAAVVVAVSWSHLGNGMDWIEVRSVMGLVSGGALWALIGAGVGFVVRHQVGAVVGVIVWTMVLDQILSGRLGEAAMYLPGQAGGALAIGRTAWSMLVAGMILVAYAITIGAASVGLTKRRDVL